MFPKGTTACGEPSMEKIYLEGLQPIERSHAETGGKCEVEEGAAERNCYGLITTPHSPSPCVTWTGKEVEELGMKEQS